MKHIIILLLLCFAAIGCNNPNPFGTIKVSGTVLLDGNPVQGISVNFNPVGGDISAGGLTDDTGKYTLTTGGATVGGGAIPGEYNVTFSKVEIEGAELDMDEYLKKFGDRQPKITYVVPQKYEDVKTSGIASVKVEKGEKNIFNFELTTK
ncbi:MAG: carboxypeptidase-like regulatory domain-containing protein [Planctomycetaceae bacterium]|jgi:hypothetical protein|nr:carboxypeptidase-like regulatory domain-containing protein [Planctomycetaceae bacterium]